MDSPGDFSDEYDVADTIDAVVDEHGRLDYLLNIAGVARRHTDPRDGCGHVRFPVRREPDDVFLASRHAIPHLRASEGAIVSVSARSSLEGGAGDGVYRASKAGVRLLTETIAAENLGSVRANAVMPSVIDTPMNREMVPDADFETWVDPKDIADVRGSSVLTRSRDQRGGSTGVRRGLTLVADLATAPELLAFLVVS
ncbi:hypothetical protein C8039_00065 [Halogeometricum sp. wsp3]|nr:hypothetical protein C8039_00065 [Halogeometricum sp. wsp3]